MRYWWVSQNQTFAAETDGNFMWSPKTNKDGRPNPFYDNMPRLAAGDIVFSFADKRIKAIGVVESHAETAPKPDFGKAGSNWLNEGWYVPVDYRLLRRPIAPKEHIQVLGPFLPDKYSPLQPDGTGNQMYLTEVSETLAEAIKALIGQDYFDALADIDYYQTAPTEASDQDLIDRGLVGPRFRNQLVKARRGQGVFRSNVLLRERSCRVTRVTDVKHLKAGHIKPWRAATDEEKLDGANGLLLSPHIDHLFDQGYITFTATQSLLIVPEVRTKLLDAWGIDASVNVGSFSPAQTAYLDYHRAEVFRRDLLEA